ncbi:hypothetical protein M9H77_04022 [Catharanthus roseus]|uniref:Uncharacterized protein n=1 Tax=Catharanthus roseus TaxID=4058 RepID=A0ACC0CD33_CATRO|nr:hypothetical protein M9H77_04022 [Catharanthus roseus]
MVLLAPQNFQKNLRINHLSVSPVFSLLSALRFQNGISGTRMNTRHLCSAAEATDFVFDDEPNDTKATKRDAALHMALTRLASDFGNESMLSLNRFFGARRAPVISTGSLKLDMALGIGGLPKGRIVEIYGQEASGKTTLALHTIKEAQKQGGYCAYLDVENAMNPSIVKSIGVNTDNLLISQPDSAENLLSMVDTLTKSGSVDVIVVDSVAALVPQHEIDALDVGSTVDLRSKIMQQALRKIYYSLSHSSTLIIFVNQTRSKLRSVQGFHRAEEVTSGGNALPFYAAVRLKLIRKHLIKNKDKATGLGISAQVIKNKLAPVKTDAELRIQFGRGLYCESEILELACEHGIISSQNGTYSIAGEILYGMEEAENYLAANSDVLDGVVKSLRYVLF